MSFSFTGVAYLLGFLALGLLSYRFFQYWQRERILISKLFFYLTGIFALFMLIIAFVGLFFTQNNQVLKGTVILSVFIQSFAFAIIAYLIIHLKFPKISPWSGFIILLTLGFIATLLTAIIPFNPYLDPSGGVDWDVQFIPNILRSLLFFITFLPLIFILSQQIKNSQDPTVKARAFGIMLVLIFGIFIGFFDFFLETILKLPIISSDIATGLLSIIVFVVIFFTQKSPSGTKLRNT